MRPYLRLAAVLAAVLVGPGACAGLSSDGSGPTPPTTPPTTSSTAGPGASGAASATPSTGSSAGPSAGLPEGLRTRPAVVAAIADTARRKGVAPEQVVIAGWSPVTWNDGSLGCPKKGMSYTQALVEGELLILRVDGGLFQYHARTGGPFTYCATPSADYSVSG